MMNLLKTELFKRDHEVSLRNDSGKAPLIQGMSFIDTLKDSINRSYAPDKSLLPEETHTISYRKDNSTDNSDHSIKEDKDTTNNREHTGPGERSGSDVSSVKHNTEKTEPNKIKKSPADEPVNETDEKKNKKLNRNKLNINELLKLNIADIEEINEPMKKLGKLLEHSEDVDFEELIRSIEEILNALGTLFNKKVHTAFNKDPLTELKRAFGKMNGKEKVSFLEKNFKKLKSLIDSIGFKYLKDRERDIKTEDLLAAINDIIKKINKHTKEETISLRVSDNKSTESNRPGINSLTKLFSDTSTSEQDAASNFSFRDNDRRDPGNNNFINIFKHGNTGTNSKFDPGAVSKNPEFRQQLRSIIDNSKVIIKDNRNGSFSVKLYPRELGHVNVNIGMKDGIISGKFLVNNHEARDILLLNLSHIKDQLEEAGISVGEFQVNVNDQRETYNSDDNTDKGSIPVNSDLAEKAVDYDKISMPLHYGAVNYVI